MIDRSTLMSMLRNRAQMLGHRAGVHVALHSLRSSADLRRSRMLQALEIDVIFDVGANIGQYGQSLREAGFSGRIVSFEPQEGPRALLTAAAAGDTRWEILSTALGDADGEASINVAAASGASSLLDAGARHLAEDPGAQRIDTQRVTVRRLDVVAKTYLDPASHVGIKLDVQGYESHVLAGATELIARADYIECELLLAPYYEDQALAQEIIALMYENGLRIAGTDHGHVDEVSGTVTWMDVVFVRHSVPSPASRESER